ncbi:sensor histidine kinase [Salininema proteolyticum]|uniref:histidine kinase n=1 Tax=Salininema proteolyticum TaxID=1607685 RepID=A0ABV8TVX5_9ACTN
MKTFFARLGRETGYNIYSFPLGLASFVLMVVMIAAGGPLAIVWVGLALLVGALYTARGFAVVERASLPMILGEPNPAVHYKPIDPDHGPIRRFFHPFTVPQYYLDVLHGLLAFPLGLAQFVVTVVAWSFTLANLAFPLWWAIVRRIDDTGEIGTFGQFVGIDSFLWNSVLHVSIGLACALLLPFVMRGAALGRAHVSRAVLTGLGTLQEQVDDLSDRRDAAQTAESEALRRIERDIHDGPQQQLLSLGMDLNRTRALMDSDPDAARDSLDEAIVNARGAIDNLRAVSRGIAPPILADRGLKSALEALAGRSAIPVDLDVDAVRRYPKQAETTVYFVVAEALSNAFKHSRADEVVVTVHDTGGSLAVRISDNGVGGAVVTPGHGLAGLHERLRSVGGQISLDSPDGGPTVITADVPCG